MIGYCHITVVCLYVMQLCCALWLNDTSYSKSVRITQSEVAPRDTIYFTIFSFPTPTLSL